MSLITVPDFVTFTRDRLRESSANAWTDPQLMRAMDKELYAASYILYRDHGLYLHDNVDITYVADQATYALPPTFMGLLAPPLRTDLNPDGPLTTTDYSDYWKYLGATEVQLGLNTERYVFEGNKIRIVPTPTAAGGTLRVDFARRPPPLHSGTAQGTSSATTLVFDATPTYGTVDIRDDAYNGCVLYIHGGTGAGESAEVTDYDGGTVTATVDFTTTPDATSVYSVVTPWPEEFNYALCYGSAATLLDDFNIPNPFRQEADRQMGMISRMRTRASGPRFVRSMHR